MPPPELAVIYRPEGAGEATASTPHPAFEYGGVSIPFPTPDGTGLLYQYVGQNFPTGVPGAMVFGEYAEYFGGEPVGNHLGVELSSSPEATLGFAQLAEISSYIVPPNSGRQSALQAVADTLYDRHAIMMEPVYSFGGPAAQPLIPPLSYLNPTLPYSFSSNPGFVSGTSISSAPPGGRGWFHNFTSSIRYYGSRALGNALVGLARPGGMTGGVPMAMVSAAGETSVNVLADQLRGIIPDRDGVIEARARSEARARDWRQAILNPSASEQRQVLATLVLVAATRGRGAPARAGVVQTRIVPAVQIGPANAQAALTRVVDRAVADLAANPGLARDLMSPGSYRHLVERTRLADASYGKAVERLSARYVQADPELSSILSYQSRRFVSTPDFFGYEGQNLRLLDITTERAIPMHQLRSYGSYTQYVTHPGLPPNLRFPR